MIPVVDMKTFEAKLESQATQARAAGRETFFADVVFALPDTDIGKELLKYLDSLDALSGEKRHFYFPGYGRGEPVQDVVDAKHPGEDSRWWFSATGFTNVASSLKSHYPKLTISSKPSFAVLQIRTTDDSSLFKPKLRQRPLGEDADLMNLVSEVDHSKSTHGVFEGTLTSWGFLPDRAAWPLTVGAVALGQFLRSSFT